MENEFPWLVRIVGTRKDGTRYHNCGGSIISSKTIATAAHCFDTDTHVAVADHDKSVNGDGEYYVEICGVITDPKYKTKNLDIFNDFDIALVTLCEELTFSEKVLPICYSQIFCHRILNIRFPGFLEASLNF